MALQLRRSLRVSQSNLGKHITQECSNTAQEQNLEKSTKSVDSENGIGEVTKPYSINKIRSLEKKLAVCQSENIKIERKQKNNLTLEFSSAAYEISKAKVSSLLNSENFKKENDLKIETSKDRQGAKVETRFRVYAKSKQPSQSSVKKHSHRYTINCYNTRSSMLVNGSRIDLFETQILDSICSHIKENEKNLQEMNSQLGHVICSAIASELENEKQLDSHQILPGKKQRAKTVRNLSQRKLGNQTSNQANLLSPTPPSIPSPPISLDLSMDTSVYICPVCEVQMEDNESSVCCDTCDRWIHFTCAKLDPKDADKIKNTDFICQICLDNALHISKHSPPQVRNALVQKTNDKDEDIEITSTPLYLDQRSKQITEMLPNHQEMAKENLSNSQTSQIYNNSHILPSTANEGRSELQNETQILTSQQPLKKQTVPKAAKRRQENEQKQYIISLEKQVNEHEKTIKLLQRNLDVLSQGSSSHITNSREMEIPRSQNLQELDSRIRQIEMQNMQNLCIFTALTSSLAMYQSGLGRPLNNYTPQHAQQNAPWHPHLGGSHPYSHHPAHYVNSHIQPQFPGMVPPFQVPRAPPPTYRDYIPTPQPHMMPNHVPPTHPHTAPNHAPLTHQHTAPNHAPLPHPHTAPNHVPPTHSHTAPNHAPLTHPHTAPDHAPMAQPGIQPKAAPIPQPHTRPNHALITHPHTVPVPAPLVQPYIQPSVAPTHHVLNQMNVSIPQHHISTISPHVTHPHMQSIVPTHQVHNGSKVSTPQHPLYQSSVPTSQVDIPPNNVPIPPPFISQQQVPKRQEKNPYPQNHKPLNDRNAINGSLNYPHSQGPDVSNLDGQAQDAGHANSGKTKHHFLGGVGLVNKPPDKVLNNRHWMS